MDQVIGLLGLSVLSLIAYAGIYPFIAFFRRLFPRD